MRYDLIAHQDYEQYDHSPHHLVLDLPKYLPRCYEYNFRIQIVYIGIEEFLHELPELIRIDRLSEKTLEHHMGHLVDSIEDEFRSNSGITQVLLDLQVMMMNLGNEMHHRFHDLHLYGRGGFHCYGFKQQLSGDTIVLEKLPWQGVLTALRGFA